MLERNIMQVKLFPASLIGGVAWLKGAQSVLPAMRFFPTGGINQDNLRSYLDCDNVSYVGGTWLALRALLDCEDYEAIQHNFMKLLEA